MADIVLKDRSGTEQIYSGVDQVELPNTDGGTDVFSFGEAIRDVPVTLDFSGGNQTIAAPYGTLVKTAVIAKPETLVPENIAKDVNVCGIIGTHEGGAQAEAEEQSIELSWDDLDSGSVVITPSEGKLLSKVSVGAAKIALETIQSYVFLGTYRARQNEWFSRIDATGKKIEAFRLLAELPDNMDLLICQAPKLEAGLLDALSLDDTDWISRWNAVMLSGTGDDRQVLYYGYPVANTPALTQDMTAEDRISAIKSTFDSGWNSLTASNIPSAHQTFSKYGGQVTQQVADHIWQAVKYVGEPVKIGYGFGTPSGTMQDYDGGMMQYSIPTTVSGAEGSSIAIILVKAFEFVGVSMDSVTLVYVPSETVIPSAFFLQMVSMMMGVTATAADGLSSAFTIPNGYSAISITMAPSGDGVEVRDISFDQLSVDFLNIYLDSSEILLRPGEDVLSDPFAASIFQAKTRRLYDVLDQFEICVTESRLTDSAD